ncbi:MAG: RNA methyltransferase [Lachnospiraceae bacterium]|nr:RNA methyltransferase [Lachnospiraceae bacterium]
MISSTVNKQVKFVNALVKKARTRREEDLFVAEGLRMCQEIPRDRIRTLYVSESFRKTPEYKALAEGVRQVEVVKDEVFRALSDTRTPQGILALVRQYHYTLDQVAKTSGDGGPPAQLMILETLQDPGNLGTILRAGEGAGVTGILMDSCTVDIYSPKVIRSTMGSVLRVPFVCVEDLGSAMDELKKKGIRILAAHLEGGRAYDQEDYRQDVAFLVGNEGNGLSEAALTRADARIHIPMAGRVESLNAAVAASVLMFEAARQRRMESKDRRG